MRFVGSLFECSRNWISFRTRSFFTSSVCYKDTLMDPLPINDQIVYSSVKNVDRSTRITTLSNGLRVASQNSIGSHCALGGYIF